MRSVAALAVGALLLGVLEPTVAAAQPPTAAPDFVLVDVAAESGVSLGNLCGSHTAKQYILEENGSGGALFDYDDDGDLDLYLVNGADLAIAAGEAPPVRNALYRNDGEWRFVEVTQEAGVGDTRWGFGAAVGDVDGDGDPDLYVTNWGLNVLYENLGDGTFRDASEVSGLADPGWGGSAAFGDLDLDGDLDLYVANYLIFDLADPPQGGKPCIYQGLETACGPVGLPKQADRLFRNDGDGTFTDVSESSGILVPEPEFGLGVAMGDVDDDGLLDIYVANDSGANFLFRNRGENRFEEEAWLQGVATQRDGRFQAGMGVDVGDADGDGRLDIVVTNFSSDHNTLYLNQGAGLFLDASYPSRLGDASRMSMSWGTRFFDLDLDGDQDLYVANGHIYPEVDAADRETYRQADHLFLNDGTGVFTAAPERIRRQGVKVSRGVAFGDLDGDLDVDLLVVEMGEPPTLLRNDAAHGRAGVQVALRGHRGNRKGIGADLRVTTGDLHQRRQVTRSGSYCSSSDPRTHFGLATATRIECLEIHWPTGPTQHFQDLPSNHLFVIPEP